MAKYLILESPDGKETCVVTSVDGHEGWQWRGESTRLPRDNEQWDGRKWAVNKAHEEKAAREAKCRDLEGMMQRIEDLESMLRGRN